MIAGRLAGLAALAALAFFFAGSLATSAGAQRVSCKLIGAITYCSDGTSYREIGGMVHGSDGTTYRQIGNTIYGSDGSSCTLIGNSYSCR